MALKQLGSTYAVGADSTAVAVDDSIQYRGNKDFLIWQDADSTEDVNLVEITYMNSVEQPGRSIRVEIFECTNLLDDPGDPVSGAAAKCFHTATPVLYPGVPLNKGLYRVRITATNGPYYRVAVKSPWFSVECWEPSKMLYIWAEGTADPYNWYFFVPTMLEGDKIRVRLQNDTGADAGQVRLYRKGLTGEWDYIVEGSQFHTVREDSTDADGHPFIASAEITDVPTTQGSPGEIWRLELSEYTPAAGVNPGPSGNNWVRFSRKRTAVLLQRSQAADLSDHPSRDQAHLLHLQAQRGGEEAETPGLPDDPPECDNGVSGA